jgi:uncharacterized protein (TIGR03435 family)
MIRPWLLVGPDWLWDAKYDIVANLPKGATAEQIPAMLQRLLAERLGLVAHRETRPMPVYG